MIARPTLRRALIALIPGILFLPCLAFAQSEPVPLESPDGPEASYAVLL